MAAPPAHAHAGLDAATRNNTPPSLETLHRPPSPFGADTASCFNDAPSHRVGLRSSSHTLPHLFLKSGELCIMATTIPRPGPANLGPNAGLDEWLEEAKQCHYLPERAMKELCEKVKEILMEGMDHLFCWDTITS